LRRRSLTFASSTTQLVITFFSSFFSMTMFEVSIYFSSSLLVCCFFTVLTVVSFSLLSYGSICTSLYPPSPSLPIPPTPTWAS
jgi:hypothetical protein